MNYQTDVIDRGLTGTDAEIAAQLSASGLTPRVAPIAELRRTLRDAGLLYESPRGGWNGSLLAYAEAPDTNAQLAVGLNKFLVHVCHRDSIEVDLTDATFAAEFKLVTAALVQLGQMQAETRAALYALAGGEQYATVTADDVAASKAAYDAEQLRSLIAAMLNEAYGAAVNALDAGDDAEAVKAAFDAAWGA